ARPRPPLEWGENLEDPALSRVGFDAHLGRGGDLVQWTLQTREALPPTFDCFIQAGVVVLTVEVSVSFNSGTLRTCFRVDCLRQIGGTRLHFGSALQCLL